MGWWDDLLGRRDDPNTPADPNAPRAPQPQVQPGILAPQQTDSSPLGFLGDAITGYGRAVLGPTGANATGGQAAWAALGHITQSVAASMGSPTGLDYIHQFNARDPQEQQLRGLQTEEARMKLESEKRRRAAFDTLGAGGPAAGGIDLTDPEQRRRLVAAYLAAGDTESAARIESTFGRDNVNKSELGRMIRDRAEAAKRGEDTSAYDTVIQNKSQPVAPGVGKGYDEGGTHYTPVYNSATGEWEYKQAPRKMPGAGRRAQGEPLVAVEGPDGQPVLVPRSQAANKKPAARPSGGRPPALRAYVDPKTGKSVLGTPEEARGNAPAYAPRPKTWADVLEEQKAGTAPSLTPEDVKKKADSLLREYGY